MGQRECRSERNSPDLQITSREKVERAAMASSTGIAIYDDPRKNSPRGGWKWEEKLESEWHAGC
jgi:hypothetical protein